MITGVVLAAGAATRMGRNKLLLPLAGEPLVRRVVRQLADSAVDEVLVVVGAGREQVVAALEGLRCRHVVNPHHATGMGSSFRAAAGQLGESAAAMFALADQPFVGTPEYQRLLAAYRDRPGGIVCARYGDVTAPPHVFSREFFPALAALEHGARPILQQHRDRVTHVELPVELLLDIDTPEDYERASALASGKR